MSDATSPVLNDLAEIQVAIKLVECLTDTVNADLETSVESESNHEAFTDKSSGSKGLDSSGSKELAKIADTSESGKLNLGIVDSSGSRCSADGAISKQIGENEVSLDEDLWESHVVKSECCEVNADEQPSEVHSVGGQSSNNSRRKMRNPCKISNKGGRIPNKKKTGVIGKAGKEDVVVHVSLEMATEAEADSIAARTQRSSRKRLCKKTREIGGDDNDMGRSKNLVDSQDGKVSGSKRRRGGKVRVKRSADVPESGEQLGKRKKMKKSADTCRIDEPKDDVAESPSSDDGKVSGSKRRRGGKVRVKRSADVPESGEQLGKRKKRKKSADTCRIDEPKDDVAESPSSDEKSTSDKYARNNICKTCGRGFRYPSQLTRHNLTHVEDAVHSCEICGQTSKYRSNIITHMNLKHPEELKYTCDKCQIKFYTAEERDHHRLNYSKCKDRKTYRCRFCYQRFARTGSLKEHELRHNGQKPFPCNFCGQRLGSRHALQMHKYTHPEFGPKPYGCDLCDRRFERKDRLKRHVMRVHDKSTPFFCEFCKKSLSSEDTLRSHMMTHTDSFRYLCSICGYGCNWVTCFKSHMSTHTGEKPYVCSECSRSFMSSHALKMHMMDHTGKMPHECPECPARFKRLSHLKSHMNTHSDKRPFQCNHCSKSFRRRDNLDAHLLTHSDVKPFKCDVCDKRFNNASNVRMHMNRIHNMKKDFKYERTSKNISKLLGIGHIVKSIEAGTIEKNECAESPIMEDADVISALEKVPKVELSTSRECS